MTHGTLVKIMAISWPNFDKITMSEIQWNYFQLLTVSQLIGGSVYECGDQDYSLKHPKNVKQTKFKILPKLSENMLIIVSRIRIWECKTVL